MSGTPTEAELVAQWKAAANVLEKTRNFADGTVAGASGLFDTLVQALEGEYTPALAQVMQRYRAGLSTLVDPARAVEVLSPVLYEYARLFTKAGTIAKSITITGGGQQALADVVQGLYEHLHGNSKVITSRQITFDTSATAASGNVGNGVVSRVTVDANGYALEACHVERKILRCISDLNTGAKEHAEMFEITGKPASADALLRGSFGSGISQRRRIYSAHAGSGPGGSLLRNSSFSTYSASATPKFAGWNLTAGNAAQITQDTTNHYRSHPGASTNASLKIDQTSAATVTMKQPLTEMQTGRLNPDVPYLLRVMVNGTIGSANGGVFVLRLGNKTVSTNISDIVSAGGWTEILMTVGQNSWPRNFDENPFDVEIEWTNSSSSGYLLVDDAIFIPFDEVDGTFWSIRQNAASPTSWQIDDMLEFTDTGGAAGTGKLQWWMWVAGLGYLPSNATPSVGWEDPT